MIDIETYQTQIAEYEAAHDKKQINGQTFMCQIPYSDLKLFVSAVGSAQTVMTDFVKHHGGSSTMRTWLQKYLGVKL